MAYTVTVYAYTGNLVEQRPPHAWVEFSANGEPPISYGFGPNVTALTNPGKIFHDDRQTHPASGTFARTNTVTEQQYNAMMAYANYVEAHPGTYGAGWNNCVMFANDVMKAGGLGNPTGLTISPNGLAALWELEYWGQKINGFFTAATTWHPSPDPLVFDLDGDGVELRGVNGYNSVLFDHNGDGVKTATGWVSADDGLLVMDRDGNGTIDNGTELFGDQAGAADGYAALAQEDSNGDGVVDANDTNFANLRIWRDLNQDGISQANELSTLDALGIASTGLANTAAGDGNVQTAVVSFTRTNDSTGTATNLDLVANAFHRKFTGCVILTETTRALPNMRGRGVVRDLRDAAANEVLWEYAA